MGKYKMKMRSFLLAGAVFPLAIGTTAFAQDAKVAPRGWVLAQAVDCGNGVTAATVAECPAAPAEEAPAADEADADAEPAAGAEDVQETAPAESASEEPAADAEDEAPAAETATEDAPVETQEAAPAEEPAPEAPAAADTATPDDVLRRAQRQQRRLQEGAGQAEPPAPAQGAVPAPAQAAPQVAPAPTGQPVEQAAPQPPAILAPPQAPAVQAPAAGQAPAAVQAPVGAPPPSIVEQQLEAQGDQQEANEIRALREKLRQATEAAAGVDDNQRRGDRAAGQAGDDGDRRGRRNRDRGEGRGNVVEDRGDRIIIDLGGGNIFVEPVVPDEGERLLYGARDVEVEDLPGGRTRTVVFRDNGSQIVTIRDRRGEIISRVRVTPDGREVVLIDNRYEDDFEELPPGTVFVEGDLPPLVIDIPEEQYIVDLGEASETQVRTALVAPPVQEIERQFTLEEVTRNERVRAYVPRIDLDTITFEFGSSTISESQMQALTALGRAMEEVLAERPDEVYLIEGHTDAVGSDYDNLILSDRRAEAVAVALSQNFDIPPENLVTEGYGEQYLKVETEAPSRENRRVSVRRITELLQAENQPQ